jgi:hypothetical protein
VVVVVVVVVVIVIIIKSHDSSGGIQLGYGLDDSGFESRQGLVIFSSPPCSDRL